MIELSPYYSSLYRRSVSFNKKAFLLTVAFMCIRESEHLLILAVDLLYLLLTNAIQAQYGALTSNKCITLLLVTSLVITTLYCALEGDFPS